MEQVRLVTAIVLSCIVFFCWSYFFTPEQNVTQQNPQAVDKSLNSIHETEKLQQQPDGRDSFLSKTTVVNKDSFTPSKHIENAKVITIDTPLYTVQISEAGAVVKSLFLKKYRETFADNITLKQMVTEKSGTVFFGLSGNGIADLNDAVFTTYGGATGPISVYQGTKELILYWKSNDGFIVKKVFTFSADNYMIKYDVSLINNSDRSFQDQIAVTLINKAPQSSMQFGFEGSCALINNELEEVEGDDIEEKSLYTGKIGWVAEQGRYFVSAIVPDEVEEATMRLFTNGSTLRTSYVRKMVALHPGKQAVFSFNLFMGPKSVSILKSVGHKLDEAVNFGMFNFIAKPCLWLMNYIYEFIPNYGVSIIILTILIKLLFWPLGNKSYRAMEEMKKLQPLMVEIRERNKNNKQQMNKEVMGLYKTYKVNPMSGCLPMIVQMPIFFALYRMLYSAIELRHAPFFGWITDLSAPDRLFHFGFQIPFMEPPAGIPVLTLIMGGTMFLQQKMSPPPGDPTQAKMMMLMPIFFTFIFINFSSGLVLYWLVNNVLSIMQQYYITKKIK